ncbi:MAG TPA: PHB depolymerase family esterase [Roseococcus sp.]|nr:PHB depolymerase family esterase [Roseococcus sp.]
MRKPFASLKDLVRQHQSASRFQSAKGAMPSRLSKMSGFGSNPGNLDLFAHVPAGLPPGAALVVVLHGCQQDARGYDRGTGWSELAEREGFALLAPEQRGQNNPSRCFNWFDAAHTTRGAGEVESIAQMVRHVVGRHGLDPKRVFITGLSAGGAMANAMLATYPELFAAGAIVAGLPHGAARDLPEAFAAMGGNRDLSPRRWGDLVRAASPHRGPWPSVSVWHGSADATVSPSNGGALVAQWLDVHGLPAGGAEVQPDADAARHRIWRDRAGRIAVESYTLPGMGHGTPIGPGVDEAARRGGTAAPFILDVGVFSTWHMAARWGLVDPTHVVAEAAAQPRARAEEPAAEKMDERETSWAKLDPAAVIDRALRATGLSR